MRLVCKLGYAVLAAVPVIAIAGCSSGNSNGVASGPPPEVSHITVGAVPTADEVGLYIAEDNGYFKQQGLDVTIQSINGGEFGMGNLQTGKQQLIAGNYVSFILAQIAGKYAAPGTAKELPINMRIIADGSQMQPGNQAIYVMPGSKFKTVADLVKYHAKVAINSYHNVGQVLLGSLFQENGLPSPQTSIKQIQVLFPDMIGELASGKVDAAWLPEPFGTIAEETVGAVPLADFDQGSLQGFPIGAYIGLKSWIQTHPNTVAAFLRALKEGQQVADTDRAAIEEGLEKPAYASPNPPATPLQAATMTIDSYPLNMDIPVMQRVSDAMFEFGLEPGFKQPYKIMFMIQPEPGMVGG
jgi:NitT/TauT family transport system substrate-binding protein